MTGVTVDKSGNVKVLLNLFMKLLVETSPNEWVEARDIYMTTVFKYKLTLTGTEPTRKKLSFTPKNIEITQLKVLSKQGAEMDAEQMML